MIIAIASKGALPADVRAEAKKRLDTAREPGRGVRSIFWHGHAKTCGLSFAVDYRSLHVEEQAKVICPRIEYR